MYDINALILKDWILNENDTADVRWLTVAELITSFSLKFDKNDIRPQYPSNKTEKHCVIDALLKPAGITLGDAQLGWMSEICDLFEDGSYYTEAIGLRITFYPDCNYTIEIYYVDVYDEVACYIIGSGNRVKENFALLLQLLNTRCFVVINK